MCFGPTLHLTRISSGELLGGGGNFGVVTSFTYRLHPVETVVGGVIAHPLDAAQELLRFYREVVAAASDDLTVFAALIHAPWRIWNKARGAHRLPHRRR